MVKYYLENVLDGFKYPVKFRNQKKAVRVRNVLNKLPDSNFMFFKEGF